MVGQLFPAQNSGLSGSAEVFYPVGAAAFDGSTTYLSRLVNGLNISSTSTFSFWFNIAGGDASTMVVFDGFILSSGTNGLLVQRGSDNKFIFTFGSLSSPTFQFKTVNTYTSGAGWNHLIASWDSNHVSGSKIAQIYVNGVSDCTISLDSSGAIGNQNNLEHEVGGTGSQFFNGNMSELYLEGINRLNLSLLSNIRKFYTATKRPTFLGINGNLPTGTQPRVYLKGNGTGFNVNSGTAGSYTTNGTLTTSATTPSNP